MRLALTVYLTFFLVVPAKASQVFLEFSSGGAIATPYEGVQMTGSSWGLAIGAAWRSIDLQIGIGQTKLGPTRKENFSGLVEHRNLWNHQSLLGRAYISNDFALLGGYERWSHVENSSLIEEFPGSTSITPQAGTLVANETAIMLGLSQRFELTRSLLCFVEGKVRRSDSNQILAVGIDVGLRWFAW